MSTHPSISHTRRSSVGHGWTGYCGPRDENVLPTQITRGRDPSSEFPCRRVDLGGEGPGLCQPGRGSNPQRRTPCYTPYLSSFMIDPMVPDVHLPNLVDPYQDTRSFSTSLSRPFISFLFLLCRVDGPEPLSFLCPSGLLRFSSLLGLYCLVNRFFVRFTSQPTWPDLVPPPTNRPPVTIVFLRFGRYCEKKTLSLFGTDLSLLDLRDLTCPLSRRGDGYSRPG